MNRELIDEIEKEMLALDERAYNYKLLSKCKHEIERLHNQNTELRELVKYWVTHIKPNGDLGITICKINGVDVATNWIPKARKYLSEG